MIRSIFLGLTVGVGALAAGLPAAAQPASSVEELVVTGRYGSVPANARSLSQTVSYADLDLSTAAGKREFRQRVNLTARYLCDKLGEGNRAATPLVASCHRDATRNAMRRVGTLEATAAPRGTTWVAPAPWTPPYPADYPQTYPQP